MTAEREMRFFLAGPEQRVLTALATRVPRGIRSNHFTVLGTLGALGAGAAYALSSFHPGWLWVASLLLAVNWLGDSLDGTLARVRRTQRPKYGYYLDHIVDAFSTTVIGLGIGLSPYVDLVIALGGVVVYLALSINVYLESLVFGVFRMAYGRIGPTEARIVLVLFNTVVALYAAWVGERTAALTRAANWGMTALLVAMVLVLATRFARNLYRLAKLEPQRFRWWE
jgi:phosphatidylglycerophosphate synthase